MNREQESNYLDDIVKSPYTLLTGEIFIGKCIKYLADTLYLIHKEQTERNEKNE